MKKPNLNKLLAKWQRRLRLQDWNITIEYQALDKFPDEEIGRAKMSPNNFYAKIWVLEPAENTSWIETLHNVELTVIHELVHILQSTAKDNEEVFIEKLAQALLEI